MSREHDPYGPADVRVEPIPFSRIPRQDLAWLSPGRIALRHATVLAGEGGVGKGVLLADWAARVSRGDPLPGGYPVLGGPRGVLIINTEDGRGDTLRPRLERAGADLDRVHVLDGRDWVGHPFSPNLGEHVAEIARDIDKTDAALLWVDPLFGSLGPEVDAYKDPDVRSVLAPLARVLEEARGGLGCAAVLVMHLSKGKGRLAERVQGSVAFRNFARTVLAAVPDPGEDNANLLLTIKGNLSEPVPGLRWRVRPHREEGAVGVVEWGHEYGDGRGLESDLTEDDVAASPQTRQEREEWEDLKQWARKELHPLGLTANELKNKAKDLGIRDDKAQAVARAVGARLVQDPRSGWVWRISPMAMPTGGSGRSGAPAASTLAGWAAGPDGLTDEWEVF